MNLLDLIIAIPIGWLVFRGWRRGIIRTAATLAGAIAGIWAAVHLSRLVASLLNLTGETAILVAFFICFVGALVLTYLLGRGIERIAKTAHLSMANKIAGAAAGMLTAVCIVAVILNGIVMLDRREKVISFETKEKSFLYRPVFITGNAFVGSLKSYIENVKTEEA